MYLFINSVFAFVLYPFYLYLWILLAGLFFLWFSKRRKVGKALITAGVVFLFLSSVSFIPDFVLQHIEQQYPKYPLDENNKQIITGINYIVVLAGSHILDQRLPITSQFSYDGLVRLIEGIRLHKKAPGAKLILSGGIGNDPVTDAEIMADLAISLGIPENEIILETKSMNTFEEALFIKPIVKDEKFLLVTSALHMPRAISLFKKLGMDPIPAPTGHLVKQKKKKDFFIPHPINLVRNELAIYELLGLIKEKIAGNID